MVNLYCDKDHPCITGDTNYEYDEGVQEKTRNTLHEIFQPESVAVRADICKKHGCPS